MFESAVSWPLIGQLSPSQSLIYLWKQHTQTPLTPGRLKDFVERGRIFFSEVKYLILDEADQMLNRGFLPEVNYCVYHRTMSRHRQTLMFSATFPPEIQNLAAEFLTNHVFFVFGVLGGACSDVRQTFHDVTAMNKMERNELLVEMLQAE